MRPPSSEVLQKTGDILLFETPRPWGKLPFLLHLSVALTLHNIYSEEIMREAFLDYEGGVKVVGCPITNLRFADDTTLICSSKQELLEL